MKTEVDEVRNAVRAGAVLSDRAQRVGPVSSAGTAAITATH